MRNLQLLRQKARKQGWSLLNFDSAKAREIARAWLSDAHLGVGPGHPLTFDKLRILLSFFDNVEAKPLHLWPPEIALAAGALGEGFYAPVLGEDGQVKYCLGWKTNDISPQRSLWINGHEGGHHVLNFLEIVERDEQLGWTEQRIGPFLDLAVKRVQTENAASMVITEMAMDSSLFSRSMATSHLFQLGKLYGVSYDTAARRVVELSPVPLVALIESFGSRSRRPHYQPLQVNAADYRMLDIISHVVCNTNKCRYGHQESVTAYKTSYSLAWYVYPVTIPPSEGATRKTRKSRVILFMAKQSDAPQLGVFNAFPAYPPNTRGLKDRRQQTCRNPLTGNLQPARDLGNREPN